MSAVSIYRDDVWAGDGRLDRDGEIVDCPAILGVDQGESETTYEMIEEAIWDDRTEVERPDGIYTWTIDD